MLGVVFFRITKIRINQRVAVEIIVDSTSVLSSIDDGKFEVDSLSFGCADFSVPSDTVSILDSKNGFRTVIGIGAGIGKLISTGAIPAGAA